MTRVTRDHFIKFIHGSARQLQTKLDIIIARFDAGEDLPLTPDEMKAVRSLARKISRLLTPPTSEE